MRTRALTRAEVRELDRRAVQDYGVPSLLLMENAGRACAAAAAELLVGGRGEVVVLCGPGNNGGDGLVVARTLWNRGRDARVLWIGGRSAEEGSGDVRANARMWRALGREIEPVVSLQDADELGRSLERADVVVDALFGTGLSRPVEGLFARVIRAVNRSGRAVLAVDVPSGLDADRGEVLGEAIRATRTVTFVAPKAGFERGRAPDLLGRWEVAEIGIPRPLLEALS